jgi:hypothetical protein
MFVAIGSLIMSFGSSEFNVTGVVYQVCAISSHAVRMNLSQSLLRDSTSKMDSLVSLYYFAPIGTLLVGLSSFLFEVPRLSLQALSTPSAAGLLINAILALTVNVTTFLLVRNENPLPWKDGTKKCLS